MQTNFSVKPGSTAHELPILPAEIQHLIWTFMCSTKRFVNLRYIPFNDWQAKDIPQEMRHHYRCIQSDCPVPVVLQICKASRHEGLKHYKLHMGDLSKYDSMYMNLRFDIIIARGSKEMRFNLYTALADSQFENIAIVYPGHMFSGKQNIDKMFNSLKRIVVLGEADSKITRIPGVDLEGLLANKSVVSTEQLTYDKVRWLVSTYKKFELLRQAMDIDGDIVSYERGTRVLHLEFKQKT